MVSFFLDSPPTPPFFQLLRPKTLESTCFVFLSYYTSYPSVKPLCHIIEMDTEFQHFLLLPLLPPFLTSWYLVRVVSFLYSSQRKSFKNMSPNFLIYSALATLAASILFLENPNRVPISGLLSCSSVFLVCSAPRYLHGSLPNFFLKQKCFEFQMCIIC